MVMKKAKGKLEHALDMQSIIHNQRALKTLFDLLLSSPSKKLLYYQRRHAVIEMNKKSKKKKKPAPSLNNSTSGSSSEGTIDVYSVKKLRNILTKVNGKAR